MSKLLFILTFLAASIAFAGSTKPIECATSNGKIRYEGKETLVKSDESSSYQYAGEFLLTTPRSDRHYVVGDLFRDASFTSDLAFLATASILVIDATACADTQSQSCTLVRRAALPMLCSYIEND